MVLANKKKSLSEIKGNNLKLLSLMLEMVYLSDDDGV